MPVPTEFPKKEITDSILLPSDRLLTEADHLTADCVPESVFLGHYGKFYYMRKDYDRTGGSIVAVHKKTPCVNWMMATKHYQMRDSKAPNLWKGNPPFDMVVSESNTGFASLFPEEGFYHRCENVWGGSWFERWAYLTIMREESNLDLWRVRADGNDDCSFSFDIVGEDKAMKYFEYLRGLRYNTITPEWCGDNDWYFTN